MRSFLSSCTISNITQKKGRLEYSTHYNILHRDDKKSLEGRAKLHNAEAATSRQRLEMILRESELRLMLSERAMSRNVGRGIYVSWPVWGPRA
jgi:hypothetical protein